MADPATNLVPYDGPVVADDTGADPAPAASSSIPAGWHVETIPDHNGVQRQYAVSPDNKAMVALSGIGSGAAGAGTGDTGTGTAPPTTATAGQPTGQASPQLVPYDGPVIPEDAPAPPPHSWLDELAIGGRAAVKGIDNIAQMMATGGGPLKAGVDLAHALGVDPTSLLDLAGVAKPQTDNERLASEAITGAATAAPFAMVGGPVLPVLLGGAASGGAGEGARQAGYGPLTQFAVSVLAGTPFALAPAAGRVAAIPFRHLAENIGESGAEARASSILQGGAYRPIDEIVSNIENRPTPVSGSQPLLAEVAGDEGLAGVERGHLNTAPPNQAAAMRERQAANAIARTTAASEAMGEGSPQAIQDYAAGEMTAAEQATARQQTARQAATEGRLATGREIATRARQEAETGLAGRVEQVGQAAERDATGAAARTAFDAAYEAAKGKTRGAYAADALNQRTPITIPRAVFQKLLNAADDFYGDGGGEIPARLQAIISDMAAENSTIRTLTNVDRRLADFAGEARMAGRNAEGAFAERLRGDLGDFVQKAAPKEYRDALAAAKAIRAEQGRIFETGDVARNFARDRYGNPVVGDNALASKLVGAGPAGGDTADRLIAAVGPEHAESIVRQELRRVVEEKGVETAAQARALRVRYGEVARRFLGVRADLERIEQAAAEHDAARGVETSAQSARPTPEEAAAGKERAALHDAILKTPLARVADPAVDPSSFIGSLLKRADKGRQFQFLVRQVKAIPDALNGVRRALGDYIVEAGKGQNTTAVGENIPSLANTRKAIATVLTRGGDALTGQQKLVLRKVARELDSANFAATMAKPVGSDTAMNTNFAKFLDMVPGVPKGASSIISKVMAAMNGGNQVKELLTQAILDPDFAVTLLKRTTPKHWDQVKAGLAQGRKTMAASVASRPLPIPANDLAGAVGNRLNQAGHLAQPVAAENKDNNGKKPPQQQGGGTGPNDSGGGQDISMGGVQIRHTLYPGEDAFFKAHPKTAGMAADDGKVILNPYSSLSDTEKQAVVRNETARVLMRQGKISPPVFDLTPEQRQKFAGYSSNINDVKQTIAARILSGDPSVPSPTSDQLAYVAKLRKSMAGKGAR